MNPISTWLYQKSIENKIVDATKENQGINIEDLLNKSQIKKDEFNKSVNKLEKNYVLVNLEGRYFTAEHIIKYFYQIKSKIIQNINREVFNELIKNLPISEQALKDIIYSRADREELTFLNWD